MFGYINIAFERLKEKDGRTGIAFAALQRGLILRELDLDGIVINIRRCVRGYLCVSACACARARADFSATALAPACLLR